MATLNLSVSSATWLDLARPQQTARPGTTGYVPQQQRPQTNPVPDGVARATSTPIFRNDGNSAAIRSPLANPDAYFTSRNLMQRVGDMLSIKEAIGQSITTLRTTNDGVGKIGGYVEQARDLVTQAYGTLGNDATAVAKRRDLAAQFNALKDRIDGVARTSARSGQSLLAADTYSLAVNAQSRRALDAIPGLSGANVTNLTAADTYMVRVSGSGLITGNTEDIARAQAERGFLNLSVSGSLSDTGGGFGNIALSLGRDAGGGWSLTLRDGEESITYGLFGDGSTPTTPTQ
ncbi:MAG TPA: hypothetical protein VED21_01010, partial [Azospirillum sp.]|nr:hypothetical protein [Azospirillum sp.]